MRDYKKHYITEVLKDSPVKQGISRAKLYNDVLYNREDAIQIKQILPLVDTLELYEFNWEIYRKEISLNKFIDYFIWKIKSPEHEPYIEVFITYTLENNVIHILEAWSPQYKSAGFPREICLEYYASKYSAVIIETYRYEINESLWSNILRKALLKGHKCVILTYESKTKTYNEMPIEDISNFWGIEPFYENIQLKIYAK